ncbi:MAG: hypothetical protein JO344_03755, partial [Planctomycetaceae bacterium]|nr:hypothetical protein [Planctomycetaceae bacterium]
MPNVTGFHLDWHAGASAQVEIFSPGSGDETVYKLKYTPPMRATIRPPVMNLHLGPGELDPVDDQLDVVVKALNEGDDLRGGQGTATAVVQNTEETAEEMQLLGNLLLNSIFPG